MNFATIPLADEAAASVSTSSAPIQFKTKQVKTKVTEVVKKRNDGPETVYWEVRVGSAVAKVYFTPSGERDLFTLAYWTDGKRKREVFPSKEIAIEAAKKAGGGLTSGELLGPNLTSKQRVACARALEVLAPTGVPIEAAASEYAQAFTRLKGVPLLRAVDFYLSRFPVDRPAKMVKDVVTEMLAVKRSDKLSERYVKQLEYNLTRLAKRFHGRLSDVRGEDVDDWLRELNVGPRTRNNLRNSVQALFNFSIKRKYLAKDHDELDSVPVAKDGGGEIEIYTPEEMKELLTVASPEHVPFLAISAFAGVRHAEVQRLDWANVDRKAGIIEIRAGTAKTASRRVIPMAPNLKKWLKDFKRESGKVCGYANMVLQFVELTRRVNGKRRAAWAKKNKVNAKALLAADKRAEERLLALPRNERRSRGTLMPGAEMAEDEGWKPFLWKHNALRHSFISYRVAKTKNVAQVALEAGNSPRMIFQHYRELVRPEAAKAWFGLMPAGKK
jgi:integrase